MRGYIRYLFPKDFASGDSGLDISSSRAYKVYDLGGDEGGSAATRAVHREEEETMRLLASHSTRALRAFAGVAIAAAVLVAGCGGDDGDGGSASQGGSATLKLAIAQSGGTGENPIMPIVRAFEKENPN